ncbi:twin-arginine translocation signal domain-containing protein [Paracoccus sp. Z330]|uniref:Twin-arginine translocation signal domain-containing protein n=1 Tax=Paracoccus onchidii TaxID=3017813 RepID=A0ABT4ZDS9_9RHOB|nr:twin-arginine translocation signal domain-containing protein [Paracoccus onchidii]MDB6176835.1 twin-arginine translocation signal domain-containing protein [Paracoccus onchidii]
MPDTQNRRSFLAGVTAMTLAGAGLTALGAAPLYANPVTIDWDAAPVRLMMVEAKGCIYCAAWNREIGPGYPASAEGRAAPLLRLDIDGAWPNGIALERRPTITPTFILLRRGAELARIEGYPGDQFFYPVIAQMMTRAGIKPAA